MLRKVALALVALAVPVVALAGPRNDNEKALRRLYVEGVNQGNLDLIDQLLADNFVEHEDLPGFEPNRAGVKQWFTMMRTAFPDLNFDVHFMMSDGDKVAAYITMTGTQAAEFFGIPSKGNSVKVETVDIIRFENGKAVEHWGVTDTGAMIQQLTGEVPVGQAAE